MPGLDPRLLAAWSASAGLHHPGAPASPADLTTVEAALGRHLPDALRELYLHHDGGSWVGGDLQLLPLLGDELGVARASAAHRDWGWPVPEEVVLFGSDGGGDPFGVWLPDGPGRPLVVHVGSIGEPGCLGVVGEDVNAFLRGRTAFYLQLPDQDTTAALDALGVPAELRSADPDDDTARQLHEWANPTVDWSLADPYEARLTADDVRRISGS